MPSALRSAGGTSGPGAAAGQQALGSMLGKVPQLTVVALEPGADVERREGVADLTGGP